MFTSSLISCRLEIWFSGNRFLPMKWMLREKQIVFVTVRTTCFDALVKAVDTQQVKEELWRKGHTDLVIQMGPGLYIPSKVYISIHLF